MQTNATQKVALININTLKKPKLRHRTDRAWFSHLIWHPARTLMEQVYSFNPGACMKSRKQWLLNTQLWYSSLQIGMSK